MGESAFERHLTASRPHAFTSYAYDIDEVQAAAKAAVEDLQSRNYCAVDISPGDVTRYQFVIVRPPGWRYAVFAEPDGGAMFLPDNLAVDGGYMRAKMECHPYSADFFAAFLAEMRTVA